MSLFVSGELKGRIMIHQLGSEDLYDPQRDFGYLASFCTSGSGPSELKSADGVAVSSQHDLSIVADQANYRLQAFRNSDVKRIFGLQ